MRTVSKVLAGLVLVVPMGAYVAGALAASADTNPQPRQTIEIRPADSTPTKGPSAKPTEQPGDHSGPGRDGDDDGDVEVITPDYDDFDDHDDDDHDDDSGHGRGDDGRHDDRDGDDDNSGHGGGDDN
jgi:hypothetical protein